MPIYALGPIEPDIAESAFVHPDAVIIGQVWIGPEASVWPCAVLRGDHGRIVVGARTSVQDGTVVHTTRDWPTLIGADCVVGHNAHLEGCVVEDMCLIGSGSVTLNRARIGMGAIVAAAALVQEGFEVPPGALAAGVPATIKKTNLPAGRVQASVQSYIESAHRYRAELRRLDPSRPNAG
ncbi:MAG TPA: gamma carbonic anhydrase family protein [Streptosporangiaceae bacterium]